MAARKIEADGVETTHTFYYTHESSGDVVQAIDVDNHSSKAAIITFYCYSKNKDSLSAEEYAILEKALEQMTFEETVRFFNSIMTDHKIVEVQSHTSWRLYPC